MTDERALWSATASTMVVEEELTFRNANAELSGTLFLPVGRDAVATVVVAHASASPLRSAALYGHLTKVFAPLGVAVFIFDRRGSGRSEGSLRTSDYTLLADDALASVQMLSGDARVDPKRIGIWGLSQGGWLALLATSRSSAIAFVVSVSAPMVSPDVQMVFSSTNSLRVSGYAQADVDLMVATRKAVDGYMRGGSDRATAQRMVDAAKAKSWFNLLYMGESVEHREFSRWRKEIEFDPLSTVDQVTVPTLLLYGATDPVVPVAASVDRLKPVVARNPKLKLHVVDGADHSMQMSVDPKNQLDPDRADAGAPDAPEYFAILSSWLTTNGVARVAPHR